MSPISHQLSTTWSILKSELKMKLKIFTEDNLVNRFCGHISAWGSKDQNKVDVSHKML